MALLRGASGCGAEAQRPAYGGGDGGGLAGGKTWYHLVMTNIALENPNHKWKFIAVKIIYFCGPSIPWQAVK